MHDPERIRKAIGDGPGLPQRKARSAVSLFLEPDAGERLPVSLLTGFLGSGKTTLLNRLLGRADLARTAVVINEFGEVALDQHFIEKSDGEVVVLPNGCLCCSVQGDLEGVVGTLFARRGSGEVPAFERLVIETSGLADPAPIMQLLLNHPMMVDNLRLDAVVTTVDAIHGPRQLDEHDEAVKQVALADRLLITKTDLADAGELDGLTQMLSALNPGARRFLVRHGDIAPSEIFGGGSAQERGAGEERAQWLRREGRGEHEAGHGRRDPGHLHGIASFSLEFEEPLEWRRFSRWLTSLKIRHADNLLRVKGLLKVAGEDGRMAIHGVHHVFHPPVRYPERGVEDSGSRIVFVTRGLSREAVMEHWRAFNAANPD